MVAVCLYCRASHLRLRRPSDAGNLSTLNFPTNHITSAVPLATFFELLLDNESFVEKSTTPEVRVTLEFK